MDDNTSESSPGPPYGSDVHDALTDASANADVDRLDLEGTRMRWAKKLIHRTSTLFLHRQAAFNRAMAHAERETRHEIVAVDRRIGDQLAALQTDLSGLQLGLGDQSAASSLTLEELELVRTDVRGLAARVGELASAVGQLDDERADLRIRCSVLESLARDLLRQRDKEDIATTPSASSLDDEFYRAFESAFRGDPAEIRERVSLYLPDIVDLDLRGPVVDLGCGRGEWLEVLASAGIEAYGVDLNSASVEDGRARGLNMLASDVLEHVRSLRDSSVAAISAFHIVEHLPFEDLVTLADESLRVLQPGGRLLIETPNASSMYVGAATFHLDPTHRRPVLPALLDFLLRQRGFTGVQLRYFDRDRSTIPWPDEPSDVMEALEPATAVLDHFLFGPADYAAIATR